ncbi:hypothetical protein Hanom_Chr04g00304341 [Helianthus anomalus]
MKLAQSIVWEDEEVVNPAIGKPYKTVIWPATKQTKTVVIVRDNVEYMFLDTRDFMCFGENDNKLLAKTQIQSNPQYEVCAKSWIGAVAQILGFKLW